MQKPERSCNTKGSSAAYCRQHIPHVEVVRCSACAIASIVIEYISEYMFDMPVMMT